MKKEKNPVGFIYDLWYCYYIYSSGLLVSETIKR